MQIWSWYDMRVLFFQVMVARNSWNVKENPRCRCRKSILSFLARSWGLTTTIPAFQDAGLEIRTCHTVYIESICWKASPNASFRLERPGISQSNSVKTPGLCLTILTHFDLLRSHASPIFQSFEARFLVKLFQINNGNNNKNQNNENS